MPGGWSFSNAIMNNNGVGEDELQNRRVTGDESRSGEDEIQLEDDRVAEDNEIQEEEDWVNRDQDSRVSSFAGIPDLEDSVNRDQDSRVSSFEGIPDLEDSVNRDEDSRVSRVAEIQEGEDSVNRDQDSRVSRVAEIQEEDWVNQDQGSRVAETQEEDSVDQDQDSSPKSLWSCLWEYIGPCLCRLATRNKETSYVAIASKIQNAAKEIDMQLADADLDKLSQHISTLMKMFKGRTTRNQASTLMPTSSNLKEFKELMSNFTDVWEDIFEGDTNKAITGLLRGMDTAVLATTGLIVVVIILEKCDAMKTNKKKCISLLEEMIRLADNVKDLKQWPQVREGAMDSMRESTVLVVEGSLFCCSLLGSAKLSRFLFSSDNKRRLTEFEKRLKRTTEHLNTGLNIFNVGQLQRQGDEVRSIRSAVEVLSSPEFTRLLQKPLNNDDKNHINISIVIMFLIFYSFQMTNMYIVVVVIFILIMYIVIVVIFIPFVAKTVLPWAEAVLNRTSST